MGVQERSGGGGGRKGVFSFIKKNFYRSICLVVLTARVVSECIDGGEQKFREYFLYCFGWGSELKCIKSHCHHVAIITFRHAGMDCTRDDTGCVMYSGRDITATQVDGGRFYRATVLL